MAVDFLQIITYVGLASVVATTVFAAWVAIRK